MAGPVGEFGRAAKGLSGNPLGIIALFITLVYGLAALVTTFSADLSPDERLPLIYFLVGFPVLVLAAFVWLVSKHSGKLFAPRDFRDEDNYVRVATSAASLAAARHGSLAQGDVDFEHLARLAIRAVDRGPAPGAKAAGRILWVDDKPANNATVRRAFTAAGYNFILALSTEVALDYLEKMEFAAILSDMSRPEGDEAGLHLLREIRSRKITAPFFVYTSMHGLKHRDRVLAEGGQGVTSDPDSLFESVTTTLSK
ncbi:response regulator [Nocardia salmonicida]|uniref:response regulator n=1 Tax=Nocardia salmonicida TaxID=53431 RepID=UPI00342877D4